MEKTGLYCVVDMQTEELVLTVPNGVDKRIMAFDQQDLVILPLEIKLQVVRAIRFDITTENFDVYHEDNVLHLLPLAMYPLTGQIWWEVADIFKLLHE